MLLRDYLFSFSNELTVIVEGLENGWYDVATFNLGRQDFIWPATIWVQDDESTAQDISGEWSGALVAGESHALHQVLVTDGTLRIDVFQPGDAIINGLQLSYAVPAPPILAIVAPFLVARRRRRD